MQSKILRFYSFKNAAAKFLVALFVLFCNTANATDWYVNDGSITGDVFTSATGSDGNPGTAAAPFATLQFAIGAATNGDFIYVDAGNYVSGDIFVTKSVTIRGAKFGISAGPAEVPSGRGTNESIINAGIYFGAAMDNITIDGITVNVGTGPRGIESRGLNTVIINNILLGSPNPFVIQQGIATRSNAPTRTHSYTISHNNVSGFRFGIYMDGGNENPSEISYNFVTGAISSGYIFTASNGHNILFNVSQNNFDGMVFNKGNNLIQGNTVTGNPDMGIRLAATANTSGNNMVNNYIINNGIGINLTEDNAGAINNLANYNSITGNTTAISSTHSGSLNAKCNSYGTVDPSAIAALISGNVVYIPFLTDGTDSDPVTDGFQPTTSCVVVPVILTSFSADVKNYDVFLKWQTASEVNSSHFVVERSTDNQHFENIGRITTKGFSSVPTNYQFKDDKPINFNRPTFYRLVSVDRDGSMKYSEIIHVVLKANGNNVRVFPNPAAAGTVLNTRYISESVQSVKIVLVNTSGQLLKEYEFNVNKGSNILNLQLTSISPGNYYLRIRDMDGVRQLPLFIY